MKNLVLLIISVFFALNINANTSDDLFNQKFPEYNSALNPNGSVEVTKENLELFRGLYKKLKTAVSEVEMYKFGGFPEDGGEIFTSKELKTIQKAGELDVFDAKLKSSINSIKLFLADKDQFGADKMDCQQKYSNFKTRFKQKDYKAAFDFWKELKMYYPKSYSGIYSKGEKLIKIKINEVLAQAKQAGKDAKVAQEAKKIEEANTLVEKQKELLAERELWIDTLLLVLDDRIKYFSNSKKYGKGYLLGSKGGTIYKYRKKTDFDKAYDLLKQSIEIEKDKSKPTRIKDYFDASMDMVKANKIEAENLVDDYNLTTGILNKRVDKYSTYITKEKAKTKPDEKKIKNWTKGVDYDQKISKYINGKFATSQYSKCEYLVPAFKNSFEENKNNAEWLEKKLGILSWKECTEDPFFLEAAKALYQLKPTAGSAAMIAIGSLKKKNYPEAGKYFKEAYEGENENLNKKAEYYYYAAAVAFAQNKFSEARRLARKAASTKPNYGKPYVLIAKMYAASAGSCGTTKFEKSAVYWAAVDKLVKARSITKEQSVKDDANKLIGKYSRRFPSKEEGFMLGKYKGNPHKIGCWIGETTTVRY